MRIPRAAVWVLLPSLGGCVAHQYAEVERATEEYERCVAAHGEEGAECRALAERKRQTQQRYEGEARRAWGCDPAQDECPTPR